MHTNEGICIFAFPISSFISISGKDAYPANIDSALVIKRRDISANQLMWLVWCDNKYETIDLDL